MAAAFSRADGGRMLRVGSEGLSWATRNTWSSSWEAVQFANCPNVGLVVDAFNVLTVEFAGPFNPAGHGRIYPSPDDSMEILTTSMASLSATVPGGKVFFFQCGDAELMDPTRFVPPRDPEVPLFCPGPGAIGSNLLRKPGVATCR